MWTTVPGTIPSRPVRSNAAAPSTPFHRQESLPKTVWAGHQRLPGAVAKLSGAQMDQWRRDYPEAFEREYDPAAGLRLDAWVEGGK
jgi:hypothetical protein